MLSGSFRLAAMLRRPELAAAVFALCLGVYLLGGETALLGVLAGLPVVAGLAVRGSPDVIEGSVSDQVIQRLDAMLRDGSEGPRQTGCFVLQFEDTSWLSDRHGRAAQSGMLATCIGRVRGAMRPGDRLFPLEDGSLVVVLAASQGLDLAGMTRIAGRLQLVVQQPIRLGDVSIQVTCCIGYCHARQIAADTGRDLLDAAQIAVDEALRHGPGAIRAFSADLARCRAARDSLRAEFAAAIDAGQIRAHFQPQVSTDTGAVSGMEALARWHHPYRGLIGPAEFLPALDGTDLMGLLGRKMLQQALQALVNWDRLGLGVPAVSVNFSPAELADPEFPDHLVWAVDAQGLTPRRLTVEVLESVVAGPGSDIIRCNLERLAELGFGIDLDDFGTGNASITTLRHFALRRLKIDRSFVRGVDHVRDQQNLVTAILSLAEQLGLETLAEGVETRAEHAMLAQLGCAHVQGYVIAKPLAADDADAWLRQHREGLAMALQIGTRDC